MVLTRYILKEHLAPFCYALFVITFLFLIDFLIRILSSILSKGLEWRVVLEIIVLNLAWMLALSIPMAVLVSALMAFGRLSADNEVTALRALGISPVRALMPVLFLAALLGASLVWFNDKVLPEANFRAYGPIQEAMSGITSVTGYPGEQPYETAEFYGDPNMKG